VATALRDDRPVRLALASIRCDKGDLDGNLSRHVEALEQAKHEGCELAVFPEMSLTGSLDPAGAHGDLVGVDHPVVAALVAEARARHVAVLFGLSEQADAGPFITQLYAHGGVLRGAQRKRHLGEGEDGYRPGRGALRGELGAVRFGSVICAEASQPWAWDESAEGASLVCFSSAPGLHGRRGTDAEWRSGVAWWESHGLGQAREHAARLGVLVAMATQAGSTIDEDFPGISALVAPDGEVLARTPGREPDVLVAEVPLSTDVEPVRWAVRALVVDDEGRTLLAQFRDDAEGHAWWVPPGGGIESGEDDLSAVARELHEELGRDDLEIGPRIGGRGGTFLMKERWFTQYERWYLCHTRHFEVAPEAIAASRDEGIRDVRWWSADEIRNTGIHTGPRNLPDLLDRIAAGRLPPADTDLGF
jgi:predicted amidohydrolase